MWFLSPMPLVSAWWKSSPMPFSVPWVSAWRVSSCHPFCLLLFCRVALTLVPLLLLLVLLPVSLAALFLPPSHSPLR